MAAQKKPRGVPRARGRGPAKEVAVKYTIPAAVPAYLGETSLVIGCWP